MHVEMLDKAAKFMIEKAPTILAAAGAVGTVTSVVMSADSAIRAKKEVESSKKQLSKADKAAIYAKAFAPTAIMTTATLVCIYGSNKIHTQRMAGLAGAYILKEAAFKEYREKTRDMVGEKKFGKIREEILQDHIDQCPPSDSNTIFPPYYGGPEHLSLWWDEVAKRYVYCSAERIRKAELVANRMLLRDGFVSVNDVYELLKLDRIKTGDDSGWTYDRNDPQSSKNQEVTIILDHMLANGDVPCGVIDMDPWPNSSWFNVS